MLTDISNFTLYELASIKGEKVSLCRYKYYDSEFNEGFVIASDFSYFFVRIKTEVVAGKYDVHFLIVKDFHNCELNDAFSFTPFYTGYLEDLVLLKSTVSDMEIKNQPKADVTTECGLILEFENDVKYMIYPKTGLFSNTSCLAGTDEILDVIGYNNLKQSRFIIKDENLLKEMLQYESLRAV